VGEKLKKLRELMKKKDLDAYIIPSTDPHHSEYVAPCWKRRAFISGFTGSAGTVVVTMSKAGLWTDSRYFIQAENQLRKTGIDLYKEGQPQVPSLEKWLADELENGAKVGVDPWVFSTVEFQEFDESLQREGKQLVAVDKDLVDEIWGSDRPSLSEASLKVFPTNLAGESCSEKVKRLRKELDKEGADTMVIGALDEIAWLMNLRGADVAYNPVFIAYAIVDSKRIALFVAPEKVTDEVRDSLPDDAVVLPYDTIDSALAEIGSLKNTVWLDPATVNYHISSLLDDSGAKILAETSPIPAWKAKKNETEIKGMRSCHLRDAVAMVKFLAWIKGVVSQGGQSELTIAAHLEQLRSRDQGYIGPSFTTISAYGPHGAIVHYSADKDSDSALEPKGLLLVDSGGQYQDGTTDITRTITLGTPTVEQRRAYTAVLLGHLRLSRAMFPEGTDGYQLDVIARAALWENMLNYGHGTGHGVGAALCVHEGPFSVSTRKNLVPLEPGNILSIEPGFYKEDAWGIRIENLAVVRSVGENDSGNFLGFETLTLCPYERELIDKSMLCDADIKQVDEYHSEIRKKLSGLLEGPELKWLQETTRPL